VPDRYDRFLLRLLSREQLSAAKQKQKGRGLPGAPEFLDHFFRRPLLFLSSSVILGILYWRGARFAVTIESFFRSLNTGLSFVRAHHLSHGTM
jgi:hypothetical protein